MIFYDTFYKKIDINNPSLEYFKNNDFEFLVKQIEIKNNIKINKCLPTQKTKQIYYQRKNPSNNINLFYDKKIKKVSLCIKK
jgi:maleate cis-trans isomerase